MNDNISPEKQSTAVPVLTTEKITGPFFKKKDFPAIGIFRLRVAKGGETREEAVLDTNPDIYLTTKEGLRKSWALPGWGKLEKKYYDMQDKVDTGEALTQEEVKEMREMITRVPGGGKDEAWEYGLYTGKLIIDAAGENKAAAIKAWEAMKTPTTRKKAMRDNPKLALVWNYFEVHKTNPEAVSAEQVLALGEAIEAIQSGEKVPDSVLEILAARNKNKARVLQMMRAKEAKNFGDQGGWESEQVKLKAYEYMVGMHQKEIRVNAQEYWEKAFLPVIEARLRTMCSPAVARLEKTDWEGKDYWYLDITKAKDIRKPKHGRVYAPQLAQRTVASNTEIGGYLNHMGVGEKWRGEAYLQEFYWGIYMGQWIDEKEARQDARTKDVFARLNVDVLQGSDLRAYTGMDEAAKLTSNPLFLEALDYLYTAGGRFDESVPMKTRLEELAKRHNFNIDKDLPSHVTAAVMWAQIWGLDAWGLKFADRRKRVYFMREYHHKQAMQRGDKSQQEVLEVLGFNFKLTESPLLMLGYIPPLNLATMDYHALVEDERLFNPGLHSDQADLAWQNLSMYCLQQRDPSLRTRVPREGRLNRPVSLGRMGEYCAYDNDRTITDTDGKVRYDHREAFYRRVQAMSEQDREFRNKPDRQGKGKSGWNGELRVNVDQMLKFLQSARNDTIRGVRIQTNGGEIFFNDQLAKLLYQYEKVEGTNQTLSQYSPQEIELLDQYLNMRNTLRDIRALGLNWSLDKDDPEVWKKMESRNDLMIATLYNLEGEKARVALMNILDSPPFRSLSEQAITPATVLGAFKEIGHRNQAAQKYPCLYKFYLCAMTILDEKMRDLEIVGMDQLDKVIDPNGQVMYGIWGTAEMAEEKGFRLEKEGIAGQYYRARKEIEEELQNLGYLEKMKDQRMTLIGRGHYESWFSMSKQQIWREWGAEAMQWQMTRTFPTQQRFGVDNRMALYHNPHQPVLGWEVVDVTAEEITGSRYAKYGAKDEKGERNAKDKTQILSSPNPQTAKPVIIGGNLAYLHSGQTIEVTDIRGAFCLIADPARAEKAETLGWVRFHNLPKEFEFDDQRKAERVKRRSFRFEDLNATQIEKYCIKLSTDQAGELFGGVRQAVFAGPQLPLYTDFDRQKNLPVVIADQQLFLTENTIVGVMEIKDDGWCQVAGIKEETGELVPLGWIQSPDWQKQFEFVEQAVDGYALPKETMHQGSRLIWKKTSTGWRWMEKTGEWKYDNRTGLWQFEAGKGFRREFYLPGDDLDDQEATLPWLILKDDQARDDLTDERYMEIFQTLYGRGEPGSPKGYHKIPLGADYAETETAPMEELFRGIYWLFGLMRTHEVRLLARNMNRQYNRYVFGEAPLEKIKSENLLAIEDMGGEGRIWGEDFDNIRKYETSLWPRYFLSGEERHEAIEKMPGLLKPLFKFHLGRFHLPLLNSAEIGNWAKETAAKIATFSFKVLGVDVNVPSVALVWGLNSIPVLQGILKGGAAIYDFITNESIRQVITQQGITKYMLLQSGLGSAMVWTIGGVVLSYFVGRITAGWLHVVFKRWLRPERGINDFSGPAKAYLVDPVRAHKRFKPKQ